MEGIIRRLHSIEVVGVPVGIALGFTLGVSVVKILKNLSSRIPAIGNLINKIPLAVGFGIAYLMQLPTIKRLIGEDGANMISVASLFMGIEEQIKVLRGQTLTDMIASFVQRPIRALAPATAPVSEPYYSTAIQEPYNLGEIGVGSPEEVFSVEDAIRLNLE